MADEESKESSGERRSPDEESRRMRITPEQRKFLGPARSRHDWVGAEEQTKEIPARPARTIPESRVEQEQDTERGPARPKTQSGRLSRALEMQNVVLLLGGLLLLVITFYVGKKFEYWKYVITSRNKAQIPAAVANRFPNASAAELVERGMIEERLGNWGEAIDRFIAAKYKDLRYPGLLFRAGKLYYDHGNFDKADALLERAVAFGENVEGANYYRGMIAKGRDDYPAAERFFEAASNSAPFNADYLYSLAETLRRDHRPKEAIARYEQAAVRAAEAEENICRFKERMTMLEAGDIPQVSVQLEEKKSAGPLSVDWLMTAAALQIHAGRIDEAARLVQEARMSDRSLLQGHFAACAGDKFFTEASKNYPQIAEACRIQTSPSTSQP
jgi:tetratricopeptide (TPR) repeat protein